MRGALARADPLRGLVAVHVRHLDVEQDEREVFLEQARERLCAGDRGDDRAVERLECDFRGEEVRRHVIDDEDPGA